jgi:Protein of unknown function (DUF3592)
VALADFSAELAGCRLRTNRSTGRPALSGLPWSVALSNLNFLLQPPKLEMERSRKVWTIRERPVANNAEIITLFGRRPPLVPVDSTQSSTAPRATLRTLGHALLIFAGFFLILSGYLGFVDYLLQTRWIKTAAEVRGGQIYEDVHRSAKRGVETFYGFRCTVSFPVAGEARQSQLDFGGVFASKMDAEIWAARFPPGSQIPVFYQPRDASLVRFAADPPPSYATVSGTLKLAACMLVTGLLACMASKSELPRS